jgi:sodium transport system permease protein
MNWSNVKLIGAREVRDQLRDRRTLFMIAVLPMLLYPLLGMLMFQMSQFRREKPTGVLVAGACDLDGLPPLVAGTHFVPDLFPDPSRTDLLELHFASGQGSGNVDLRAKACSAVQNGEYDTALYFPPGFGEEARAYQEAIRQWREQNGRSDDENAPTLNVRPEIIYSAASEKSQIAFARLSEVWRRWNGRIGETNLAARGLPANAANPFQVTTTDLAEATGGQGTAIWAKILPVLLLLWAMTGAFYPAIDLCAGEKERGTLETLLSSPAERSEIVLGKLLTIMVFSMATAVLNILSLGITGWLVLARMPQFGTPPASAAIWLAIALVPVSALFSALCLALAAFAKSTKEGQYYLIPLLLVTLPLVVLPMTPGVELNLGNSLIPITGLVLLLRSILEGAYWQALQFAAPVAAVTLACCLLAIRWAVDQFNSESVLFCESERLDVGLRLRHLIRDRRPTPTVAAAVSCGLLILIVRFFLSFAMPAPTNVDAFVTMALVTQLVVVAVPTVAMTLLFTRSPRKTLLLKFPRGSVRGLVDVVLAAVLAVALHPGVLALQSLVMRLYPVSQELQETLGKMFAEAPSLWQLILVVAAVPAVCEELAFRGFILSGFRHLGHKWRAIIYGALFFGLTHSLLQQSMVACVLGVVLGYLAVQSGSILPGMIFHLIHNSLAIASIKITPTLLDEWPILGNVVSVSDQGGLEFRLPIVLLSLVLSTILLIWFHLQPHWKSEEELQTEAIRDAAREEEAEGGEWSP